MDKHESSMFHNLNILRMWIKTLKKYFVNRKVYNTAN